MAVSWLGPGTVVNKISDTNYLVNLPERRDSGTIYHVNMLKPYYKRPEFVNSLIANEGKLLEDIAEIPYPVPNSNNFDLQEIIESSQLDERLNTQQIKKLGKMLQSHSAVFSSDPGTTHLVEMKIELTSDVPIILQAYQMSPRQTEILRAEVNRLLDLVVIEIGQSNYASTVILVEAPRKDLWPCVDYRRLNAITRVESSDA